MGWLLRSHRVQVSAPDEIHVHGQAARGEAPFVFAFHLRRQATERI